MYITTEELQAENEKLRRDLAAEKRFGFGWMAQFEVLKRQLDASEDRIWKLLDRGDEREEYIKELEKRIKELTK